MSDNNRTRLVIKDPLNLIHKRMSLVQEKVHGPACPRALSKAHDTLECISAFG